MALAYLASFIPPVGISLRASMGDNLPDSVKNVVSTVFSFTHIPACLSQATLEPSCETAITDVKRGIT